MLLICIFASKFMLGKLGQFSYQMTSDAIFGLVERTVVADIVRNFGGLLN